MKLHFYPERQQPISRQAPYSVDKVRLVPGENELSDAQYQKIKDTEAYKQLLAQGAVVEEKKKKTTKKADQDESKSTTQLQT